MAWPYLALLCCLVSLPAAAGEDARVTFLVKQLGQSKDLRVRTQTLLLLGQTTHDAAVVPLCRALTDRDSVIRSAAANALGEIRSATSVACLHSFSDEADPGVQSAIAKSLQRGVVAFGALYVHIEPVLDQGGALDPASVQLAEELLRAQLSGLGAGFAAAGEDKKWVTAFIRQRKLKGYQLRLQLVPADAEKSLKLEMLVLSYPEKALKGTWNVKASGAKPDSLLKAMVPRVVQDAAADLEWKN